MAITKIHPIKSTLNLAIDYMREKIEKLSREIWQIHSLLLSKSKESSGD